ncbi:S8/S53 family peptidase [Pyxidicoccus xibeiensis]|uniref:S8/S53 family peptidase n=1 Tax=Pyxidicoccus xibeiensis TaxID=2906759 RepID=UPI0020A7D2E2|nr:S8/S53 family peptidase [Pyxidicoccus xibeiensis]MCP3137815.1 S8/S53 family peptidase [Pyxidicoccus xibeiensis]
MDPTRRLLAITLAFGVAACMPSGTAPEAEGRPPLARQELASDAGTPPCPAANGGTCVAVSPAIAPEAACPSSRWIAVLKPDISSCPPGPSGSAGQWVEARLFAATKGQWALPPGLAPFCSYDWVSSGSGLPPPLAVAALKSAVDGRTVRIDPDCQVVAPLGTSATVKAAWQMLQKDFHAQTERLAVLPTGATLPPVEVRVAVVDSSPHRYSGGEAVEDRLGHGHAMGRVVRELGCPDGSPVCIAQVSNHLSLPQVTPNVRDLAHGGYFGEQTQLARAIHNAVTEWRAHNAGNVPPGEPATPQPRLVVNLSLAWDARFGGAYDGNQVEQLPAPVRAVHAAITHAVCRGAVVIAAAGNDPGGPDTVHGPMLPARWEQKPAPEYSQCEPLEDPGYPAPTAYPRFPPANVTPYRPLVYAVGGVRADDAPLASTRPGGRPRLAAPGAHALASDTDVFGRLQPTDILTGTSVSTAVVSGVAATSWGYRPDLSGPELMERVRQGSVPLGTPADFCLGGLPCPWPSSDPRRVIGRVSLFRALEAACKGVVSQHCPSLLPPPPAPRPAHGSPLPTLDTATRNSIESKLTRTVDGSALNVALPPLPICRQSALRSNRWAYDETVCPFRQYYGIPLRPWTNPQPSKNPCTCCLMEVDTNEALALAPTATLYLSIDSEYVTRSLDSPTLLLNGRYELDISGVMERAGQPTLTGGDEVKVTGIPIDPAWLPIDSAELMLRGEEVGVPYSTSSELLLQ